MEVFGMNWVKPYIESEYDTHREVILRRSRVGNGSRPQACKHELQSCIKRVVLRFSRGLYQWNGVSEVPGHGMEDAQRGC